MASECPYTTYLTKGTGTSFIHDEICLNNFIQVITRFKRNLR